MTTEAMDRDRLTQMYRAGRRDGLAVAALVVSLVAFLSLLGAEKAITAIVLGALAMRGAQPTRLSRRLGTVSIVLGSLFVVTLVTALIVFWDQLQVIINALQKLS